MSSRVKLFLFIAGVVLTGWVIGWLNIPDEWYASLQKPPFNPPNWIFSPVWTILYVIIGIVGWRVWVRAPDRTLKGLWSSQMVLNFAWSPAFFGLQNIGLALITIALLCVSILAFIWLARNRDRLSAALFIPYLAWVGFATVLNAAIFSLN